MNILLINHYAGSPDLGMEFRPYYMAKAWQQAGHKVRIIGATYSHLRKQQPQNEFDCIDGIPYQWVKVNEYSGNGMGRVRSMFAFVGKLLLGYKKLLDGFVPEMVIASSTYPLDIYPAHTIAKKYKAKLVYEIHDLWPLSPMLIGGYSKNHPFIAMMQHAENYAYKHADKVVSLLWNAKEHAVAHGMEPHKFACIPNGYDPVDWNEHRTEIPAPHHTLLSQLKSDGKVVIGYAGGHTQSTALHVLVAAAQQLQENATLAFVLVGSGNTKEELMHQAQQMNLQNIHFLPPVDKKCIPHLIQHFDIVFMGGTHSILHQYGTSFNKMTDYMLSSKPIVCAIDEPNNLIERLGCGLRVEAENPQQVAAAITKLCDMTPAARDAMGTIGREYAESSLSYPTLAQQFVEVVKSV